MKNQIIERINSLRTELNKETENLKKELESQLAMVVVSVGLFKQLGVENILSQEPFKGVMDGFGRVTTPAPVVPLVPTTEIKSELSRAIIKSVSKGKNTQSEIEAANGGKKLYGKLQSMVEDGLLKKEKTEKGMTYSLPQ